MKQLLIAIVFSCSSFFVSAQDISFGSDYYAMLKKIPTMTQKDFVNSVAAMGDTGTIYAFVDVRQKYIFLSKTGNTLWMFNANATGSGFGINKTENEKIVFSKFYDDGGNEQNSGFSKKFITISTRNILCTYFKVMCK